MDRLPPDHFFHLCTARERTDLKQEQYLILLERCPQTENEAIAALETVRHRHESTRRREKNRIDQLDFDPIAPQPEEEMGVMISALDLLPDEDQTLLTAHIIAEESFQEIANREKVSKQAIRKRFLISKKKLDQMVKSRLSKAV